VDPKPGSPPIEAVIDRAHARLLHRTGHQSGAFEVYEDDRYRWLQNDDGTLQSLMDRRSPERLVLPYTAAMMAGLLFVDTPRSVLMLGLGGASHVRFLRHYFAETRITVRESEPDVIDIARRHFGFADVDERIRIVNEDARTDLAVDDPSTNLILVDLFAAGGLPPWVREKSLHACCRRRLDSHGVQVTSLWVDADDEFLDVMSGVQKAYDKRTLVLTVPGYRNLVVLAFKTTPRLDFASLEERAIALGERTGLDYIAMLDRMRESSYFDQTGFVL
jgi:spermidine synthase